MIFNADSGSECVVNLDSAGRDGSESFGSVGCKGGVCGESGMDRISSFVSAVVFLSG